MNLTGQWPGIVAPGIFVVAYAFVVTEEFTLMRKSKPVLLAAGLIRRFQTLFTSPPSQRISVPVT